MFLGPFSLFSDFFPFTIFFLLQIGCISTIFKVSSCIMYMKRNTFYHSLPTIRSIIKPNVDTCITKIAATKKNHPACKCDRFEQKQPCGWVLTNPLNAKPLRPHSTFIDGFSKLMPQRIPVEIRYLLVYCP